MHPGAEERKVVVHNLAVSVVWWWTLSLVNPGRVFRSLSVIRHAIGLMILIISTTLPPHLFHSIHLYGKYSHDKGALYFSSLRPLPTQSYTHITMSHLSTVYLRHDHIAHMQTVPNVTTKWPLNYIVHDSPHFPNTLLPYTIPILLNLSPFKSR